MRRVAGPEKRELRRRGDCVEVMEYNSRKVKCKWGSLADVSPNKCLKYGAPDPCSNMGSFEYGQESTYQSGRSSLSKSIEEKQATTDSAGPLAERKSGMEIEYLEFPGGSAHNSLGTEGWASLRRIDPSIRKTLFHKHRCEEQSSEMVSLQFETSIGKVTSKETSQEESSLGERKSRMMGQASTALFKRALQDAIGSTIAKPVRRATPTPGREGAGTPCQRMDLSGSRDGCSQSFGSFTSGEWEEQETEQGLSAKCLSRNAHSCAAAGSSHHIGTEAYFGSGDRCHSSNAIYPKSREGWPSDTALYPKSRESWSSDTALYAKSRESRHCNTAVYESSKESRHSDPVVYPSRENGHSETVVYPKPRESRPCDIAVYQTSKESRLSDPSVHPSRVSRHIDPTVYPISRESRPSDPSAHQSRVSRHSDPTVYPISRESRPSDPSVHQSRVSRHSDPTVYPMLRESRLSALSVNQSTVNRHSDPTVYPISSESRPSDPSVHPSRVSRHTDPTVYPISRESRPSDPSVHQSRESRHADSTIYSTLRDSRPSNAAVHPTSQETRRSDPAVHTSSKHIRHSDPAVYLTLRDDWPSDTAVCPKMRGSRYEPVVHPSLKDFQHSTTAVYPVARDGEHMCSEVSEASNESRHVTMESCIAPGDDQSAIVEQLQPACVLRLDNRGEASRLVFLHEQDSDEDGPRSGAVELDQSFGSDFSDVDDVIPLAIFSQEEPVEANGSRQEDIMPVAYPPPLFHDSWFGSSRHWTSSPVYPSTTGQSILYHDASRKMCVSGNSTLTASSSLNSTKDWNSLTEGWCCRSSSFSDSCISEAKSRSFNEEPDLHVSVNQEAHTLGIFLSEIKKQERLAQLPGWMCEGFIDTHCHLDMLYNKLSFTGTFAKFRQVYSSTFPKEFQGCIADFCNPRLTKKFPWEDMLREDMVWGAFGCHPHFARFYDDLQEQELLQAMRHPKAIAFGEMGLDYSHKCSTDVSKQKKVFERQLQLAVGLRKPLVIHCRDADEDLLEIMKRAVPRDYKIHRHCFTGRFSVIEPFLEEFPNMAVGFTALVTYPTAIEARDTVRKIPLEKIIIETDAPYFVPKQVHKSVCPHSHPGLAIHTVKEIARIKELPLSSVVAVVRQNTNQLYNL